ncbi:MAG: cupredoxin domain-containing protein [Gemmatimonadaceae bacterium]
MIRAELVVLAVVTVACAVGAAADAPPRSRHEIRMRGNSFTPRDLTLELGDTVVWRNADVVRHNAVRPETFDSGDLRRGEEFSWVPQDTGAYRYRCTIHQRMRGTLTVTAKP